ncbi:MAG TPA: hypothetical protein VLC12_15800, partial [Terriglobales bacterium]|nr:hypothetical protein [Terriglobales bacterium]
SCQDHGEVLPGQGSEGFHRPQEVTEKFVQDKGRLNAGLFLLYAGIQRRGHGFPSQNRSARDALALKRLSTSFSA